ncbi:MAG TPA: protoporphyrinogen oxidase [Candidatus Obscuribacterales bacterium]
MVEKVAIVGGGISGLAAAHRLTELSLQHGFPLEVSLLEAGRRLGGSICTRSYGDFIVESGPDSFITQKPWALELCQRLGLANRIIQTNDKYRCTFVAFNGKLHALPDGFVMLAPTQWTSFLQSSLFSWPGKLRFALDLFVPAKSDDQDESLASFVRRRFGREALERVAQPMIGGVYTADPEKLSMKATMPRFLELERSYGSVIRGLARQKKGGPPEPEPESKIADGSARAAPESGARYSMFVTLDDGLQVLVDALAERISRSAICLDTPVSKVVPAPGNGIWNVVLASGETLTVQAVVLATPADVTARLISEADPALEADIASISLASSVVLNFVYARKDIPHPLNGFGFVVPAVERRSIIACSFSSVKFPRRAPEGKVILRVFMGGALQPEIYELSDQEIESAARSDLAVYLGITGAPLSVSLTRHPRSMPQFRVGHLDLVSRIEQQVGRHRGLALAGNAYRGVGIPDCIHSGEQAAESVFKHLAKDAVG